MELAFLNIGTQEMFVIVVVILMLFGGKKLPELARGLGRGIREFKDASEGIKKEIADQINNFEKDLDVTQEEKQDQPSYAQGAEAEQSTAVDIAEEDPEKEVKEKKIPQFTTPANTYQHDPGAHPVDEEEYYKYGYKDHFAEDPIADTADKDLENISNKDDKPNEQA